MHSFTFYQVKWNLLIFLFLELLYCVHSIDWNSDIVPNQKELKAQDNDALAKYFGEQVENADLFRTYQSMQNIVGEFKDVPLDK